MSKTEKFSKLTFYEQDGTIQASIGTFVAFMTGGRSRISAKYGRLFAAAPELLDCMEEAVTNCGCSLREKDSGHKVGCFAPRALEAISKAKGVIPSEV